jgi:hypothetical protein
MPPDSTRPVVARSLLAYGHCPAALCCESRPPHPAHATTKTAALNHRTFMARPPAGSRSLAQTPRNRPCYYGIRRRPLVACRPSTGVAALVIAILSGRSVCGGTRPSHRYCHRRRRCRRPSRCRRHCHRRRSRCWRRCCRSCCCCPLRCRCGKDCRRAAFAGRGRPRPDRATVPTLSLLGLPEREFRDHQVAGRRRRRFEAACHTGLLWP